MKPQNPLPEEYRDFVEGLVDAARATLETHGVFLPIVVLGSVERKYLCPVGGLSSLPPTTAMEVVRALAIKEQADFVLLGSEVWIHHAKSEDEAARLAHAYSSVEDMPEAQSAVYFSLETYCGTWDAITPCLGDEGHYTFGEVEFDLTRASSLPFRDMLPRRSTDTLQ